MVVDCDSCVMRDRACGDCVVTLLLGPISGSVEEHRDTLSVLSDAGLVPPLRLVSQLAESEKLSDEQTGVA